MKTRKNQTFLKKRHFLHKQKSLFFLCLHVFFLSSSIQLLPPSQKSIMLELIGI